MTVVMNSKKLFSDIKCELKNRIANLESLGIETKLACILPSNDAISKTYVDLKRKDCHEVGIKSEVYELNIREKVRTRQKKMISLIHWLNERNDVHGVLIQLPFPDSIDSDVMFHVLSPEKDVDGLTPLNMGRLFLGQWTRDSPYFTYAKISLIPCTPKGVLKLFRYYKVEIDGKDIVILGRSNLVGNPLRKILEDSGGTVTCFHTGTIDRFEKLQNFDIVISAVGRPPELYDFDSFRLYGDMIRKNAIVVGIGVRKSHVGKLYFDVDFDSCKEKCSFITPNLGGVGLMTRAMLLENVVIACENQARKSSKIKAEEGIEMSGGKIS